MLVLLILVGRGHRPRHESPSEFIAFLLFLGMVVFALQRVRSPRLGRSHRRSATRRSRSSPRFVAALVFPFTQGRQRPTGSVAAYVGVFAATAIGLNIVVGLAGLLDLGYVAFLGVGAYVGALLSGSASARSDVTCRSS